MRKTLFFAAVAAIVLGTSCEREVLTVTPEDTTSKEKVKVTVNLSGDVASASCTRANLSVKNESRINNVQLFAFESNGSLDTYVISNSASTGIEMQCSTGEKDFVAIVNAPSLSHISTKSELWAANTKFSENTPTNFVMTGSTTADPSSASVNIPVKRIVARINIKNFKPKFSSPAHAAMAFHLMRVYVINVAGNTNYEVTAAPTEWYNQLAYSENVTDSLTTSASYYTPMRNGESYTRDEYLYVYPNPTVEDSQELTFSSRHTRLVVETKLNGATYYYPITIGGIQRNKTYSINEFIMTRPGSKSPDIPVTTVECPFTVTAEDWEEGSVDESMSI